MIIQVENSNFVVSVSFFARQRTLNFNVQIFCLRQWIYMSQNIHSFSLIFQELTDIIWKLPACSHISCPILKNRIGQICIIYTFQITLGKMRDRTQWWVNRQWALLGLWHMSEVEVFVHARKKSSLSAWYRLNFTLILWIIKVHQIIVGVRVNC